MKDRKEFWAKAWQMQPGQEPYSIDRPYCKAFHIRPEALAAINSQVYTILFNSMDEPTRAKIGSADNYTGIIDFLSNTEIFFIDVANQLDRYIELERIVLDPLKKMKFFENVSAVQLPIDIRVVHPEPPPKYLQRRDAVDFLHTDAWRGEPPDVVNCVLYCAVTDKASQLVVYDVPKEGMDDFVSYTGSEREAGFLVEKLAEVNFAHAPGETVFFDAYTPHNTRRNGNEVRISLNFSFRRGDPYETIDERWDRDRQPWCKYWFLPQQPTSSFTVRSEQELEQMTRLGLTEQRKFREEVIQKLRIAKRPEEIYA